MKEQSLRNISEQVDTAGAELEFPGMADKTPFPASSQVPSVPLSQHQAHTTDIPLAVPKLSAASGAVQTTDRGSIPPQAQAKPPSSCGFDSGNRWRACAQGRGGVSGWQALPPLPKTHAGLQGSVAASVSKEKSSPKPVCPLQVWC